MCRQQKKYNDGKPGKHAHNSKCYFNRTLHWLIFKLSAFKRGIVYKILLNRTLLEYSSKRKRSRMKQMTKGLKTVNKLIWDKHRKLKREHPEDGPCSSDKVDPVWPVSHKSYHRNSFLHVVIMQHNCFQFAAGSL